MLHPLIFRNFFRNIQKIKNELRPSFVAVRRHLPLGGKVPSASEADEGRMRGGYINEKQNFSEGNSRYAAERISRNSLG